MFFIFHVGVIHFFRSFISFLRSFISFLRRIFYSPRGDFETSTWKSLFSDTTPFRYVVGSKLLLRPSPRRHPTRHSPSDTTEIGVTAFDAWNCRADVACVGADLRVRPQNRLRSGEDGRTHRSAPTVEAPPRRELRSALVDRTSQEVRRIIAVGRRGKAPNDPRGQDDSSLSTPCGSD